MNTIVQLQPVALNGSDRMIIAVDAFTKWAEVGVLRYLDSATIAAQFHNKILCRYGVPYAVRSDHRIEY